MLNKIFAVAATTVFATTAFAQAPSAGPAAGPTAGPVAAPAASIKPAAAAALEKKVEAPKVDAAKADAAKTVDGAKNKATHAHKHAADAAKQAADTKPVEAIPTK
ncbi:hypothetical protein [Zoogloea dura]|uniref:Cell envelope biogenesis protein TolA n=1 Tax=Zoogloea dura TaxID=2728840 RepID=A0A848G6W1_9RHOO|nr:hypothetical protein [Zoogloea dura]NML26922.1 hypothetical protein [Zoogloea dura]